MDSMKYAAICIVAAVMIIFIKEYDGRFAVLMRISFSVSAAIASAVLFGKIYSYVKEGGVILGLAGDSLTVFEIMLKSTGIAFIGCIASSICRDSGENGIATTVETVCKLEKIILCIPVIDMIIERIEAVMV